jgi:transcriptional regulator with XRE-family HTH domain
VDIHPDDFDVIGLVRTVRRRADLSQRELAERAAVSASTVNRIEAGALTPSLAALRRILAVAELDLVPVDRDGRLVRPMLDHRDDLRDGAERRYPSHLDTWYGLARPPETFHRSRRRRDVQRRRSQWETRGCPGAPPRTVDDWLRSHPEDG